MGREARDNGIRSDVSERRLEQLAHDLLYDSITMRGREAFTWLQRFANVHTFKDDERKVRCYFSTELPLAVLRSRIEHYFVLSDGGDPTGIAMRNISRYYGLTVRRSGERKVRFWLLGLPWALRSSDNEVIGEVWVHKFNLRRLDLLFEAYDDLFTDCPFGVSPCYYAPFSFALLLIGGLQG